MKHMPKWSSFKKVGINILEFFRIWKTHSKITEMWPKRSLGDSVLFKKNVVQLKDLCTAIWIRDRSIFSPKQYDCLFDYSCVLNLICTLAEQEIVHKSYKSRESTCYFWIGFIVIKPNYFKKQSSQSFLHFWIQVQNGNGVEYYSTG